MGVHNQRNRGAGGFCFEKFCFNATSGTKESYIRHGRENSKPRSTKATFLCIAALTLGFDGVREKGMARIYLDNAATTPLLPAVANAVREGVDVFGNPSSIHQEGQKARAMVDEARRDVAALFNVRAEQIIFTSGGTEANALALKGAIAANRNFTLITQATEHDCVLNTAAYFSEQGTPVHFVAVDDNGVVRLEALEELLKKHSI
jgi:selenocysteine lyase/cysteine desulfurase